MFTSHWVLNGTACPLVPHSWWSAFFTFIVVSSDVNCLFLLCLLFFSLSLGYSQTLNKMSVHFWVYMLQISPTQWKITSRHNVLHLIKSIFSIVLLISHFLWLVLLYLKTSFPLWVHKDFSYIYFFKFSIFKILLSPLIHLGFILVCIVR